jgi:hypothetical protein
MRTADPNKLEAIMRAMGYLATTLAAAAVSGTLVLMVESLPDIRRYLRPAPM